MDSHDLEQQHGEKEQGLCSRGGQRPVHFTQPHHATSGYDQDQQPGTLWVGEVFQRPVILIIFLSCARYGRCHSTDGNDGQLEHQDATIKQFHIASLAFLRAVFVQERQALPHIGKAVLPHLIYTVISTPVNHYYDDGGLSFWVTDFHDNSISRCDIRYIVYLADCSPLVSVYYLQDSRQFSPSKGAQNVAACKAATSLEVQTVVHLAADTSGYQPYRRFGLCAD